jgi:hypothetical protein
MGASAEARKENNSGPRLVSEKNGGNLQPRLAFWQIEGILCGIMVEASASPPPKRPMPAWKTQPVLRFFASLHLALVLLLVIIVAGAVGTIAESQFDARIARAYIYGAPWFNLWLLVLALNLAAVALVRWPWRRKHIGFLLAHLGIILLLLGAWVGKVWGVEGTMTLFKGAPPSDTMRVEGRELRVHEPDSAWVYLFPLNVLNRTPTQEDPWHLGDLESGTRILAVGYTPFLEAVMEPSAVAGGQAAVKIRISSAMMGQTMERWLLVGSEEASRLDLGLAVVELKTGPQRAPVSEKVEAAKKEETTLVPQWKPEPSAGNGPVVPPAPSVGAPSLQEIMAGGASGERPNRLALFYGERGELSYEVRARKLGRATGVFRAGQILPTGWADWTVQVVEVLPSAMPDTRFVPLEARPPEGMLPRRVMPGVLLRILRGGDALERWVPLGWQVQFPVGGLDPIQASYLEQTYKLPFTVELLGFEVERNEGTETPAGFQSHLRLTPPDGHAVEARCRMNHPANLPDAGWRSWTGLTYKISQAGWNAENLEESTVQILRDPGWFFKWTGSTLLCFGIFALFYLRVPKAGRPTAPPAQTPSSTPPSA